MLTARASVHNKKRGGMPLFLLPQYDFAAALLKNIDVLVDGRFEKDKKDIRLKFRGSSNQRIIDVKKTLSQGEIVLWQ